MKLIRNIDELKRFIDFLPELQEDEAFYCCLFARKKYGAKKDQMLRAFDADKDNIINKIGQCECPVAYYNFDDNVVPETSLAFYINPTPRNRRIAAYNTIRKLSQQLRDKVPEIKPISSARKSVQISKSKSTFCHFDMDSAWYFTDLLFALKEIVNLDAVHLVKTQGGFHILVSPDKVEEGYKRTFHKSIQELPDIDVCGDQLMPIPGISQGDYIPFLVHANEVKLTL